MLIKIIYECNISNYINNVENSYSRYFNLKHKIKGPLWQSEYQSVKICNGEQLLHVSRYIHLNPTTSNLAYKPEEWKYSSYRDFISNQSILGSLMEFSIQSPKQYQKFVEDRIDYQKSLRIIKKRLLEKPISNRSG